MAALGLGSYGSDASSDDGDEAQPYPLTQPLALEEPEESEEESEEEEEAAGVEAEEEEMIGPVVPLALSGAVDESDEEDAQAPLEDEDEEEAPSRLPPPDFGDWDPEAGTEAEQTYAAHAEREASTKAARLGKRERGQSGPHQISRGFTAAVTRRDQLKAKAEEDLANDAAYRGVNSGMSQAYDSVFHVPEGSLTEDEIEKKKRMRTTRKGGVKMISKKELAKEQALEASLM